MHGAEMGTLIVSGVKSYSPDRSIEVNLTKKINLIYGQNGSGKSTISGYFYDPQSEDYKKCLFSSADKYEYIVYNSQFIEDSFYNKAEQPGIFTLSQENKDVMKAIVQNEKELSQLRRELIRLDEAIEKKEKMIKKVIDSCQTAVWNKTAHIRKKDVGLGELMIGSLQKASFYQTLSQQVEMEEINTESIISEYFQLKRNKDLTYGEIDIPKEPYVSENQVNILSTPLLPAGNSFLSVLIDKVGNLDWVRNGLQYLNEQQCPFCQKNTIDIKFKEDIERVFDESYNELIISLRNFKSIYEEMMNNFIIALKFIVSSSTYIKDKNEFSHDLEQAIVVFKTNLHIIQEKIDRPSLCLELIIENPYVKNIASKIARYNGEIQVINNRVKSYDNSIREIKSNVWKSIRYICNDLIINKNIQVDELNSERSEILNNKADIKNKIDALNVSLINLKKQTSNIDETVGKINNSLLSLGIANFKIQKASSSNFFQICRENSVVSNIYKTLSEGEKTLITFLYFLEMCDGRLDIEEESGKEKLIVIDDPISSLSHEYIYEIAALIQYRIIKKLNNNKVVVLTHNLFFYQELIKVAPSKKEVFEKKYQLLRVVKNNHSDIITIGREDIKNEYQALWVVLKDVKQGRINSIVLPNIMRNILEYYFSFSCKMDRLSEELDKLVDSENDIHYKTFYRYINRGSHLDSINISNLGQIPSQKYLELFERIFKKTNDEHHYKKMIDLDND